MRIPVATVVGMVADAMSHEEILRAFPDLEAQDIAEALRYAAEAVRERILPLRSPALRFLVDQCLSPEVAEGLATNGHDAVHLRDLGMMRAKDPDVLALARAQQRVLLVPSG